MSEPLEARNLVRLFGDERAVDGVDFQVRSGEIHAIVGLNGAGKTTLMRLLLGMVAPTSGKALIDGFAMPRQLEFLSHSLIHQQH